jgi:hypothetical protein
MNTDRLTTILGILTSIAGSAAAVMGAATAPGTKPRKAAAIAPSHAAQSYLTNKTSS